MREQTIHFQNSASPVTLTASWRVVELHILPDYRLKVRFVDGLEGIVEMSRLVMDENAGVFTVLREPELFKQAYLEYGAVTWPGEIDLAPDAMHDEIEQNGKWVLF
ncbi:MAG: DUF2442 domain-containing protein [Magnetococcus sp. YQC-5]